MAFIPNLFTLGNLLCGCLGIIFAFHWRFDFAAYMVFLAAFLDFFDGFFARILKVSGDLGKQLDSLADVVSFGVAPGLILFQFVLRKNIMFNEDGIWHIVPLIIPVFSAYRLAKFNLDTRQTNGFLGLPTPANAIFFVALVLCYILYNDLGTMHGLQTGLTLNDPIEDMMHNLQSTNSSILQNNFLFAILNYATSNSILTTIILIFSVLLVSEIPLFALKFKNFGWTDNKIRYSFLILSLILLILFHLIAIPFIVILYIIISLINNTFKINV